MTNYQVDKTALAGIAALARLPQWMPLQGEEGEKKELGQGLQEDWQTETDPEPTLRRHWPASDCQEADPTQRKGPPATLHGPEPSSHSPRLPADARLKPPRQQSLLLGSDQPRFPWVPPDHEGRKTSRKQRLCPPSHRGKACAHTTLQAPAPKGSPKPEAVAHSSALGQVCLQLGPGARPLQQAPRKSRQDLHRAGSAASNAAGALPASSFCGETPFLASTGARPGLPRAAIQPRN